MQNVGFVPHQKTKKHSSISAQEYVRQKHEKVAALCEGRWDVIFSKYGDLSDAINRYPNQVPCPFSGKGNTKFRLCRGWEDQGVAYHNDFGRLDGFNILAKLEGVSFNQSMDIALDIIGGKIEDVKPETVRKNREKREVKEHYKFIHRRNKVAAVVKECSLARDSEIAHNYFRSRGLKGDLSKLPSSIGFHPALELFIGTKEKDENGRFKVKSAGHWPAILPMFHHVNGGVNTLHRNYLNEDGNGKLTGLDSFDESKKVMSPPYAMTGGAMRIDAHPLVIKLEDGSYHAILAVGEGMETILAVREGTGVPGWACYSDGLLAHLNLESIFDAAAKHIFDNYGEVKPRVKLDLLIMEDKDVSQAGARASKTLVERCAKYTNLNPIVMTPKGDIKPGKKSQDWLDEYVDLGPKAFSFHIKPELRVPGAI